MKYIRTANGVHEVLRESETKKSYITKKNGLVIHKYMVIAEADTIPELCDEFVFKDEKGKPKICYKKWLKDTYEVFKDIKGAIWTDKGLIYVAKIKGASPNGEIDWELL